MIIPNNIGMANVSSVPLSYIFLRGQGVKINSLVTKVCSQKTTRIPTLKNFDETKWLALSIVVVLIAGLIATTRIEIAPLQITKIDIFSYFDNPFPDLHSL